MNRLNTELNTMIINEADCSNYVCTIVCVRTNIRSCKTCMQKNPVIV